MWRTTLAAGDTAKAWDLFIARYRRLITATIQRSVRNEDDVAEVFADVCADLCGDDLARLARHTDSGKARFSTWLVTVVHHRAIDWVRRRDGRPRVNAPANLTAAQSRIFDLIVRQRRSHVEAYEILRQRFNVGVTFAAFMREVTEIFYALERTSGKTVAGYFPGPPPSFEKDEPLPSHALILSESAANLSAALGLLPPDERLAVQLFVIDELSAATVAKMLGWPNAKAVYNRVYRALGVLRQELERLGVESGLD